MSEIKVNKISPRTNCGTVTLGDSGDTFTIPAGATITNNGTAAGFGATGAASWDTTVKTSGFTAVSGVGYFVNTTSGAITVTLPASPSAGDVVAVKDYANTFDTNSVTLARNGSNIGGAAFDATLDTEGLAVTLVYVDATKGWLVTDSGLQSDSPTAQEITATGGTITTSGDFKIHTFTGDGNFVVSKAGNGASVPTGGPAVVDYLVVAGGGGGGFQRQRGGQNYASPQFSSSTLYYGNSSSAFGKHPSGQVSGLFMPTASPASPQAPLRRTHWIPQEPTNSGGGANSTMIESAPSRRGANGGYAIIRYAATPSVSPFTQPGLISNVQPFIPGNGSEYFAITSSQNVTLPAPATFALLVVGAGGGAGCYHMGPHQLCYNPPACA